MAVEEGKYPSESKVDPSKILDFLFVDLESRIESKKEKDKLKSLKKEDFKDEIEFLAYRINKIYEIMKGEEGSEDFKKKFEDRLKKVEESITGETTKTPTKKSEEMKEDKEKDRKAKTSKSKKKTGKSRDILGSIKDKTLGAVGSVFSKGTTAISDTLKGFIPFYEQISDFAESTNLFSKLESGIKTVGSSLYRVSGDILDKIKDRKSKVDEKDIEDVNEEIQNIDLTKEGEKEKLDLDVKKKDTKKDSTIPKKIRDEVKGSEIVKDIYARNSKELLTHKTSLYNYLNLRFDEVVKRINKAIGVGTKKSRIRNRRLRRLRRRRRAGGIARSVVEGLLKNPIIVKTLGILVGSTALLTASLPLLKKAKKYFSNQKDKVDKKEQEIKDLDKSSTTSKVDDRKKVKSISRVSKPIKSTSIKKDIKETGKVIDITAKINERQRRQSLKDTIKRIDSSKVETTPKDSKKKETALIGSQLSENKSSLDSNSQRNLANLIIMDLAG